MQKSVRCTDVPWNPSVRYLATCTVAFSDYNVWSVSSILYCTPVQWCCDRFRSNAIVCGSTVFPCMPLAWVTLALGLLCTLNSIVNVARHRVKSYSCTTATHISYTIGSMKGLSSTAAVQACCKPIIDSYITLCRLPFDPCVTHKISPLNELRSENILRWRRLLSIYEIYTSYHVFGNLQHHFMSI